MSQPIEKSTTLRELNYGFEKIVEVIKSHEFIDDIGKIRGSVIE